MRVYIEGVGLIAPGLNGWEASQPVLRGEIDYAEGPMPKLVAAQLPAAERRRATTVTRLALEVATQAIPDQFDAADIATVFASSGGEVEVIDRIFTELATPERQISPTLFHNSVHNAASGYWSIATGSRKPSMSLSAFDDTFGLGLLEAALQASLEDLPVLLVCYDFPPLAPIWRHRPLTTPFGVALLMSSKPVLKPSAVLGIDYIRTVDGAATRAESPALESMRLGNPAARSLPLLMSLAGRQSTDIVLELGDRRSLCLGLVCQ